MNEWSGGWATEKQCVASLVAENKITYQDHFTHGKSLALLSFRNSVSTTNKSISRLPSPPVSKTDRCMICELQGPEQTELESRADDSYLTVLSIHLLGH